jgi:UDP-N-acetylmuramoyl-tripeptide--D-alanyl-D-alanine ligase
MSFWTFDEVRAVANGSWLARPREGSAPRGASIDTRALRPGQVFFALKGERVDGHMYLDQAATAGASLAVVDDPARCGDAARFHGRMGVLRVPDTAGALLRLGGAWRKELGTTRVVSIGGSNGKTTTTRLTEAVLSARLRGTASPKSFNNHLGVPLTLLNASPGEAFVVAEVGTNAPGEIAALAGVVRPDIAVITSIGREHLEGLGSLEGVAREEAAILPEVAPQGVAVLNADAPHLAGLARAMLRADVSVVSFGWAEGSDLRITGVEQDAGGLTVTVNGREVYRAPLLGRHNAWNVAAAAAVGRRFGLDAAAINEGLARAKAPDHRLTRVMAGGVTVIDDAYNANPESVRAALETFAEVAAGAARRVVVLGDMLELGGESPELHAEVGRRLAELNTADVAVFVGPLSEAGARAMSGARAAVRHFADKGPSTVAAVAGLLRPGDCVLLKGSRGMALERVLTALQERSGAEPVVTKPPRAAAAN